MALVELIDSSKYFKKSDVDKEAMKVLFNAPVRLAKLEEEQQDAFRFVKKMEFCDSDDTVKKMMTRVFYEDAVDKESPRNLQYGEVAPTAAVTEIMQLFKNVHIDGVTVVQAILPSDTSAGGIDTLLSHIYVRHAEVKEEHIKRRRQQLKDDKAYGRQMDEMRRRQRANGGLILQKLLFYIFVPEGELFVSAEPKESPATCKGCKNLCQGGK